MFAGLSVDLPATVDETLEDKPDVQQKKSLIDHIDGFGRSVVGGIYLSRAPPKDPAPTYCASHIGWLASHSSHWVALGNSKFA